ncbi:16S rRNA (guanine(527)-N(7))-methyltransferase RsmG [Alphaproteobacteria bacterium KMM 3653]|uniref:Ribosomal RNA small subunit methyltransferase G n=1 Tax=Harenicola maris TaxID=2841044 RepID=A0AAP2CR46_9RHOB|nr:16S rRNA (guanine(527)-N(7))-methyltransferase RsmG [Harenicola maris]
MDEGISGVLGGYDVSRETTEKLQQYVDLLRKWNPHINLVSKSTLADAWVRHISDSLQLIQWGGEKDAVWVDVGSGGGMPGIPCAIFLQEKSPDSRVHLVESDQRKATFLRTVSRETKTPLQVHPMRIEKYTAGTADVLTARALAPLSDLLGHAERLLAPNGKCLFLKGANHMIEVEEARKTWHFNVIAHQSRTGAESAVLEIGDIRRA